MEANNAAAMNEALEHVEKLAREFAAGNYYVSDFPKILLDAIQPALSAPPRNCDLYNTPEESIRMFESSIRESGKLGFINPFTEIVKWLFAPAEERKGEGDGK